MQQLYKSVLAVSVVCMCAFFQHAALAQATDVVSPSEQSHAIDIAPEEIGDGWSTMAASRAGFDPARLAQLTKSIESGEIQNVHAVIVERAGKLIYEQYFSGVDERWGAPVRDAKFSRNSLHDLRSVSKSVTTAVLGIALAGRHRAALDKSITEFFPQLERTFSPGVELITLQHVLTMTAGLEWNEMELPYTDPTNDENRLDDAPDPIAMVLSRPVQHPAGSKWYYNGGLAQVVAGVIKKQTGMPLHEYTQKALFRPLGITSFEWLGSAAWTSDPAPSAASGLRMTARGLAKIGSVFLHNGKWNGKQVIPADWVDLSVQPHVKEISWGRSTGVYGYGFMWYPGKTNDTEGHRLIRAAGNGMQRIFILPDLEICITMYAGNYNDWSFKSDAMVLDSIMAARIK